MSQTPAQIRRDILLAAAEALAEQPNYRAGVDRRYDAGFAAGVQALRQSLRTLADHQKPDVPAAGEHPEFCGCDACWDRLENEQLEVDPGGNPDHVDEIKRVYAEAIAAKVDAEITGLAVQR